MMIKPAKELQDKMLDSDEYMTGLKNNIRYVMDRIEYAQSNGYTRVCFSTERRYEDKVKQMFLDQGYTFKPTGYNGGVWQLTEDICW
jgi:hypothetical protein